MDPIDKAVEDMELRGPGEDLSYTDLAVKHGVSRKTVTQRIQGKSTSVDVKNLNQRLLTQHQEAELVRYINELTERRLPPTRTMIRNFARDLGPWEPSETWVSRFLRRHKSKLAPAWQTAMSTERHQADLGAKYKLYFDHLYAKIEEYSVEPRYTYNMDEKGFMIRVLGRSKRVFDRIK
ncbi:hypothetical protein EJ07DRAFT_133050 [Lizonia empirigonia]|nr:hypothetical protein EJ07DRAFT_133050 [Lizonia empirigonia]